MLGKGWGQGQGQGELQFFPCISLELSAFPLLLVKKLLEKGSRVSFNTMARTVPHPSMSSRHHPGGGALPLGHKPLWDLMGPSEQHPPLVHLTSSSSMFDQPGPLQLRAGSSGPFLWPWQGRGAQVVWGGLRRGSCAVNPVTLEAREALRLQPPQRLKMVPPRFLLSGWHGQPAHSPV